MLRVGLVLVIAVAAGGCAEEELERAAPRFDDEVQLARRDPGPACWLLAAVEVRSGRDNAPSGEAVRAYAAARGANYAVVDTFSVYGESEEREVLTRARLFRCPRLLAQW